MQQDILNSQSNHHVGGSTFPSHTSFFAAARLLFVGVIIYGSASWYSVKSTLDEGNTGITASGKPLDDSKLTCAMRRKDYGKCYVVTNLENGKTVTVKHTDFGPSKKLYKKGRKIDLSKAAFQRLAPLSKGVIPVSIESKRSCK